MGRPPAVKKEAAIITPFPIVNLTATSTAATSRKNYDTGEDEVKMDKAVLTMIQARGHHIKRTAQIYGVSGTSLLQPLFKIFLTQLLKSREVENVGANASYLPKLITWHIFADTWQAAILPSIELSCTFPVGRR